MVHLGTDSDHGIGLCMGEITFIVSVRLNAPGSAESLKSSSPGRIVLSSAQHAGIVCAAIMAALQNGIIEVLTDIGIVVTRKQMRGNRIRRVEHSPRFEATITTVAAAPWQSHRHTACLCRRSGRRVQPSLAPWLALEWCDACAATQRSRETDRSWLC